MDFRYLYKIVGQRAECVKHKSGNGFGKTRYIVLSWVIKNDFDIAERVEGPEKADESAIGRSGRDSGRNDQSNYGRTDR